MKKKIVSLVGALVLTCAMSLNVFAAGSKTAQDVVDAAGDVKVPVLSESAETAKEIITADGLEVKELSTDDAYTLAVEMAKLKSEEAVTDVVVVAMADLKAGSDTITVKMSVGSTETVYALHVKADGTVEKIPGTVSGDTVIFKFSTYSPVAIVKVAQKAADPAPQPTPQPSNNNTTPATTTVNGVVVPAAPKTGDAAMMVTVMAVIFMVGAAVAVSKKRA